MSPENYISAKSQSQHAYKKYAKDNCLRLEGKRVGKDSVEGLLPVGRKCLLR